MKTSEVIDCLNGRNSWAVFGKKYGTAMMRMVARNDGALTSGDIGLEFDKTMILEKHHLDSISCLDDDQQWTIANLVALCGFEISSKDAEGYLYEICDQPKGI